MKKISILTTTAVVTAGLIYGSCGKKKSDDDAAATTDNNPAGITTSNPLAASYPSSLAITAFPTSSTTSLMLADEVDKDAKTQNEEQAKILKGEGASCVPSIMKDEQKAKTEETCYEFDQDLVYGSMDNGTTFKGTKDGKNSSGEACLPSFARSKIDRTVGAVKRAQGTVAMMLCQAKKSGVATELAAVNDTINLKDALTTAGGDKMSKVTTAKITRIADVVDGASSYKQYKTELVVETKQGGALEITLYHVRKDDGNAKNYGVMQMKEAVSSKDGTSDTSNFFRMMSIAYGTDAAADGTPTSAYQLRAAIMHKDIVTKGVWASDNMLEYNTGADATTGDYTGFAQNNQAVFGITYIAFTGNPKNNSGTFSYWQNPGSNYSENARGMTATLVADATTGLLSGCAFSGATGSSPSTGFSIRGAIKDGKTLTPAGFYHPFFSGGTGPTTDTVGSYYTKTQGASTAKWYKPEDSTNATKFVTEQMSNLITKQCYKQDSSTKVYKIDTAVTTSAKGYEFVETTAGKNAVEPPAGTLIKPVKK